MTDLATRDRERERVLDRARELTSIGAGHAAGALASLIGRPCEMSVPEVRLCSPGDPAVPLVTGSGAGERRWSGTLFDVEGGLGGVLAVLFPASALERLYGVLLGKHAAVPAQQASALSEVGNILASHALSAIGDTLGVIVLPSPPLLERTDAGAALARLLAARAGAEPRLLIEVALCDREGALHGLLVYAPDALAHGAIAEAL